MIGIDRQEPNETERKVHTVTKANETPSTLGLYLHLPFCRSKCLYCDFCSSAGQSEARMRAYVKALCRDLDAYAPRLQGMTVDTVYFGGGTPTLLPPSLLSSLLEHIFARYRIAQDAEITAECNPATVDHAALCELRRAGLNRLSIGVQSAAPLELRAIGRRHSFADAEKTVLDAARAGFENLSADVMLGLPGQTVGSYLATLEQLCRLPISHLSAYALTLEEGTPLERLCREGRCTLPSEEESEAMYFEGISYLESRGLAQYEISNFARPGRESRHNLKYWSCEPYLGLGASAYSDLFGERFGNSRDVDAYIEGRDITEERERPDCHERMSEYIMLRLRLREGIEERTFEERFGIPFWQTYGERLAPYLAGGYAERIAGRVALTPKGFYISNTILSDLVEF